LTPLTIELETLFDIPRYVPRFDLMPEDEDEEVTGFPAAAGPGVAGPSK